VIGSPEHHIKVSLRSDAMIPEVAVVDPKLTLQLPQNVTASSGLDALTQVIEPYVSVSANILTDALCVQAIRAATKALPEAYHHGEHLSARESMAFASLIGGIALTNARLGAVHGFAGPFGGMYPAPHGAICGRLLPAVMRVNIRSLRGQAGNDRVLEKYQQVAAILSGISSAKPEAGVEWVSNLVEELKIPRLGSYGLTPGDFGELVQKAQAASSMKGNPIRLSVDECLEILEDSI
jgi:alcohol dehydrogenase class IV